MPGFRMPSNKTLGNICVYGAVASISAVMYMRWRMEDRVRSCDYYKLAISALRHHKGAVKLLGEPIRESGIDLSNANNNCNAEKAQLEVSVHGSNDKGTLYFWATNLPDKGWLIDRLELETKRNPDKRFLLKKSEKSELDYLPPEAHSPQQWENATLPNPPQQTEASQQDNVTKRIYEQPLNERPQPQEAGH
ncbi:uncharacterized protein [Drosophila pseudoobscura]|uniref:Cytochrome c oxidase assembly factor 1 homolog n=1 Tax=Drosophila pseudoobscura pseudoobscura TaxID=46245 RepID=A0A6I8UWZ4_DROPS|nr:uncharacterized protein LOC4805519 [Drosophila pseudoobscura]